MTAKGSNEIKLTRLYDAPVKSVWEAWIDPVQVAQWWGPRGFTITTHRKDTRTGGSWDYTMHGPDGKNYENTTHYLEVVPLKKLVYDHGGHKDRPPLFRVTALFSEVKGKTLLELSFVLASPEAAAETRKRIKEAGGESTWDRLAEFLESRSSGKEKFVIARSFDAPIGRMFDLWTNPEHLAKWLPPVGFTMDLIETNVRVGGTSFYAMGNGSVKFHGIIHYIAIERPHRLVYTQQFADETRNISRHPMVPTWPETMLTTVDFAEEGPDRTRVTVNWQPSGKATAEELAAFVRMRGSMTHGWSGSFDKLETVLTAS